jgi:hypothetical protein
MLACHEARGLRADVRLRRIRAALLVVALGLGLGACSKCDVPVYMPKSCHAGPDPGTSLETLPITF